jgi:hypothetical protein
VDEADDKPLSSMRRKALMKQVICSLCQIVFPEPIWDLWQLKNNSTMALCSECVDLASKENGWKADNDLKNWLKYGFYFTNNCDAYDWVRKKLICPQCKGYHS